MSKLFEAWQAVHEAVLAANICGGRVSDDPDAFTLFPHIHKEATPINDWRTGTKATEIAGTFHVWSEYGGNKECLDIYEQIREALDGKEFAPGNGRVIAYVQGGPIMRAPDGVRYHGIVRVILNHQE